MFWLKIIQRFEGYKKCPFKRNSPDHGGIPYTCTLLVKLTVSTNLPVCSAKENFLWMKSSETYASYYIWTLYQFMTLPYTDLAVVSLRPYSTLALCKHGKSANSEFHILKPIVLETVLLEAIADSTSFYYSCILNDPNLE